MINGKKTEFLKGITLFYKVTVTHNPHTSYRQTTGKNVEKYIKQNFTIASNFIY